MGLDNPLHIAFLLVILLLVFGAKRLPELGRSLGTGMRSFKDSISGETAGHEHHDELTAAPAVATASIRPTEPAAEQALPVEPPR
jgi:sec-independent protein translocase protein TatA